MLAAPHRQRLGRSQVDDEIALFGIESFISDPPEPSERFAAVRHAGMPEAHRREMRQAGMVVTATVHNREVPVFVEALETNHRRMEPEAIGDLDDFAFGNPELR